MGYRSRWLQAVSLDYHPDEHGRWKGHWIGRAFRRSTGPGGTRWRDVRGLSFASRRRHRLWAFWIGRDR